jgi:AraC-like DNA-binding protein
MQLTIAAQTFEQVLEYIGQVSTFEFQDEAEVMLKVRPDFGNGYFHIIHIKPGLTLFFQNTTFRDEVILQENEIKNSVAGFSFYLAGSTEICFEHLPEPITVEAGQSFFGYDLTGASSLKIAAGTNLQILSIQLDTKAFNDLTSSQQPLAMELRQALKKQPQYLRVRNITFAMQTALYQLQNCVFTGLTRRIYYTGKLMELIALYLADWDEECKSEAHSKLWLHPDDRAKIVEAERFLLHHIGQQPTIEKLSQEVGLSKRKLMAGFKQQFGDTIFNYAHRYQMERAFELLRAGELNVTQVANAVGYSNIGHFGAAFKKYFGVSPNQYRRSFL